MSAKGVNPLIRYMFKKTKQSEATLFESPSNLMRGRALKKYDDPKAWHNQFYELVTININEDALKPLFKKGDMGRSNASISQLVAIMVMKEGNRRSDEQMFEAVDYDFLVRKALGFTNISDQASSLDTYYLLRRRISDYEEKTGIDLIEHSFKDVAKTQALKFNIKGASIRMDSKLSKSYFCPLGLYWEAYAEPYDSFRRICSTFFLFLAASRLNSEKFKLTWPCNFTCF